MGLLTPWFLVGLAALSVPVLLHLTRRRARQAVQFPSLMFLSQVPYRSLRRRRVEQIALLAMRCLALALLALAFARPLIPGAVLGASEIERSEVIVALDRSLSMSAADRWGRALDQARSTLAALGEEDLVHLVAFDSGAEVVSPGTTGGSASLAVLNDLAPTARGTDYRQVLELSRRLVLDSDLPRQRVVLITDLQRQGLEIAEDLEPLPREVEVEIFDVGADLPADWSNLVVADSEFDRDVEQNRERIRAFARVRNTGTAAAAGRIELALDGRVVETKEVELEPLGSARIDFAPFLLEEGRDTTARLVVRAESDLISADDQHLAVLSPSQGISVLIVEPTNRRRSNSLFIEKALTFSRRPLFRVQKVRAGTLTRETLARSSVVVLQDSAGDISAESWGDIDRFVGRGGGLLVATGRQFSGFPVAATALGLPPMTAADQAERQRRRMATLDYGHPALSPFQQPRSGDFSGATFFLRHSVQPASQDRVLARFDDGSPALVEVVGASAETQNERGKLLLWTTTLDTEWNDLPLQPVFLPFVHRMAAYLAGFAPPPEAYEVGQIARLDGDEGEWLVIAPDGAQTQQDGRELLIDLQQAGIYTVRPTGDSQGERLIAANSAVSESDLSRIDREEFGASVKAAGDSSADTAAPSEDGTGTRDEGFQFWWILLSAAAALLVIESVVSARRSASLQGAAGARSFANAAQ